MPLTVGNTMNFPNPGPIGPFGPDGKQDAHALFIAGQAFPSDAEPWVLST